MIAVVHIVVVEIDIALADVDVVIVHGGSGCSSDWQGLSG